MSAAAAYAIGTLCTWAGWLLAFRCVVLVAQRALAAPESRRPLGGFAATALGAVLLLMAGNTLVGASPGRSGYVRLPVVWLVMPFWAWLALGGLIGLVIRLLQAAASLNDAERAARLKAAGVWALVAAIGYFAFSRDPQHTARLLTGSIPMTLTTAVIIVLLAVGATVAMVHSANVAKGRGLGKTLVSHAALVVGSVVFGVPFVYLLVTSFKEDRDMSSPNGIVWIPKRQQTVSYFDKANPLYEATYRGQQVEGIVIERYGDQTVKVDISKPYAIRGTTFIAPFSSLKEIPRLIPIVTVNWDGQTVVGKVVQELEDGRRKIEVIEPPALQGQQRVFPPAEVEPVRKVGLKWENYPESLQYLPPETKGGLLYLRNTLVLVVLSVVGTLFSSSIVAYAFSRMKFPGRDFLFALLLSTMMLPAAVTLLPQFLIFRQLGWVDTLLPLWVPAFFASAFNVFMLRQFFLSVPMELEDAAKIDGCSHFRSFWNVMLPQVKPALAVIAIWTLLGAWNNFMGPLIYINSPENMPLSYALQQFQSDRRLGEAGYLMAFTTMTIVPVLLLFFFAQKYFIEGVTLSGFGGR